ncbi:hypothetical protein FRC10_008050, partial [Ceratobasidium sp. 414]
YDWSRSMAPAPPPPPHILDSLKQVHFNRASWDRSATAQAETTVHPPRLLSPTRSRFASEDRVGEAQFYPGGSPTPRMSRHSEDSQHRYYHTERPYVEEPESYADPFADPGPAPVGQPAKKKSKWKKIFSRKKKGKGKAGAQSEPVSPPPLSTRTDSYPEPPPVIPAAAPIAASDVSTQRRFQLRDPGPVQTVTVVPYPGSVSESRDASLRASEAARGGGSVFGYQQERPGGSFISQQVADPEPPAVLVDPQTGNRIFREVSYVSNQTGSHRVSADGFPIKKKKRSFGGTLKRLFTRKKKVPPLVIPPPERPPPVSRFAEVEDSHPLPPVPARTHSTPPSAVPFVTSPRSSRSHPSVISPVGEVVIPVSPRAASPVVIPVRQGSASVASSTRSPRREGTGTPAVVAPVRRDTGTSVGVAPVRRDTSTSIGVAPVRRNTGSSAGVAPTRRNTGSTVGAAPIRRDTGSSAGAGPGRRGTGSSVSVGVVPRRYTGSSIGVGRRNTGSSVGAAPSTRPVLAPAPPLSKVTGSDSPSIRSMGGDKSWGEIHVPPEPVPARTPITSTRPGVGFGLGRTRIGSQPAPRVPRTPRTYTAPPRRTPYVHVPRPIPPPPRYPTLPTTTATTGTGGLEAQVQLIVTALRDLTAEHRHDRAVAEARLEEERAWTAAEREREAELRELVMRLATSRAAGGRAGVGEFGERVARTETEVIEEARIATGFGTAQVGGTTARLAGLGVGGSGEDIALLCALLLAGRY